MIFDDNHLNSLLDPFGILGIEYRVRLVTTQKETKLFYFSLADPDTQ